MALEIQRPVEAMALLAALLQKRGATFGPNARPIQFQLDSETWNFDPQRRSSWCEKGASATAVLTVECTPVVLGRLFTEPTPYLIPGEELKLTGDHDALKPLIQALGG